MEIKPFDLNCDQLLACLMRATTESFAVLDLEGRFLEANEIFCTQLGIDHGDLLQKMLFDLISPVDKSQLKSDWDELSKAETLHLKFTLLKSNGKNVSFVGNLVPHLQGTQKFVCLFCKIEPISSEDAQLAKLRIQALDTAANAVVITNLQGEIVWANRSFSKLTGYSLEEVIGHAPGNFLKSGRHPDSFYKEMWEAISRGEIWKGEILNRRKDGSIYPEEMTITPIFNEEGVITHFIAIKQDLSEKKNLQNMFFRAQRLESIGALASGVAHDLNNVLAPIVMSSDLLMVQVQDAKVLEMLQMIKESAKRGADIVRQLLTFVRGDNDEIIELQIRHILRDILKVYRETFPRHIQIEDRIPSDLFPIKGNATNLHQVFTNLMINARDAMPNGGLLLVQAENITVDQSMADQMTHAKPGEYVRIRIQDTGTGIPAEIQDLIFQSFFTTKEHGKGTGLGLPTTLTILKKHEGFLELQSSPGEGSVFDVYLPVFKGEDSFNASRNQADNVPYGKGEHVLVIDDEESIGFMLKGTLKSLNYRVSVFENGEEALSWWKSNRDKCDLILVDMMMPGMDGAEVCQNLKKEDCETGILVMSGMVSEEKLQESGIDLENCFISKPFTIANLALKIRTLLDQNK